MTAQTRPVLKSYFQRGLRPTQSNYADLIDSFTLTTETSAFVLKSGDTMTGPLVLPGNPTLALQATPKQYVDTFAPLASPVFTGAPILASALATSLNFGQDNLNYYDEGTWAPTDQSGAGLVFTGGGNFTRIGRMVFAYVSFIFPATADGTNALIGGLPFTVLNQNFARHGFVSYTDEVTLARVLLNPNATTFGLLTAAGASITNATMSGNTVYMMAIYPVT